MSRLKSFFTEFLPEVVAEMKKVTFPSRQEVIGTTGVVLVTSVIFALFLGATDFLISKGYTWLFQLTSKVIG
jgi:preprotein translocase subunit SecE